MRKLYIIILNPNVDTSSVIRRRITESGNCYVVYNNQYLLIANYSNAHDLYNHLTRNEGDSVGIVIFEASIEDLTYWGYSDKGLWSWLAENVQ